MAKVVRITEDDLYFDNDKKLSSTHERECCEMHYLSFEDLTLEDFEGLEFDLESNFFERIEDYGIALLPIVGHPVRIPGYGWNNGYYSSQLDLVLLDTHNEIIKAFDVSECQDIKDTS